MVDPMLLFHDHDQKRIGPPWLEPLLCTNFFLPCSIHRDANKSECNQYCLNCMGNALCPACLANHKDHHIVQIRRSSYHDVVRISEIQKVLDITGVQTYIINSARVVFINGRPQPRQGKGVTNNCEICGRSLLDSFRFCSLGCKLAGIKRHQRDLTFIVQGKTLGGSSLRGSDSEDSSLYRKARSKKTGQNSLEDMVDSLSSDSGASMWKVDETEMLYYKSFTDQYPMKLSRLNVGNPQNIQDISPPTPPPTSQRRNRKRKGVPHRSPMGV